MHLKASFKHKNKQTKKKYTVHLRKLLGFNQPSGVKVGSVPLSLCVYVQKQQNQQC